MGRRQYALFSAVVLLLGCSGATDGAAGSQPAGAVEETESELGELVVVSATNRVGERHGPAAGFAVTVVALDKGYTVPQILDSATPDEQGSIDGVAPSGPPLGVLSPPVKPGGLRRPALGPEDAPLLDFRVEVLNTTLEGIYDKAFPNPDPQQAFDEASAAARAELVDGDYDIIFGVLVLVGRGYTLEQAMEGYFFGATDLDGLGCLRLKDELPKGQPIPGAFSICPSLDAADASAGDTQPDPALTPDSTQPSAAPVGEESALIDGTYTGAFEPRWESDRPGEAVENNVTVVVEGGAVRSFDGILHISFPYFSEDIGSNGSVGHCPEDSRTTSVEVPGSATANTFDIELTHDFTSIDSAECPGSSVQTSTFVATVTIVTTDEGATVSGPPGADFTLELTRS